MQHSPFAADTDMDIKEYIMERVRSGFIVGCRALLFRLSSLLFRKGMKSLWVCSLGGRSERVRVVDFRN